MFEKNLLGLGGYSGMDLAVTAFGSFALGAATATPIAYQAGRKAEREVPADVDALKLAVKGRVDAQRRADAEAARIQANGDRRLAGSLLELAGYPAGQAQSGAVPSGTPTSRPKRGDIAIGPQPTAG